MISDLSLRAFLAFLTSFSICLTCGSKTIQILERKKILQFVRSFGPKSHLIKYQTPTMGGILILIATIVGTLLWIDLENQFIWIVIFGIFCFGCIGFLDDYLKIVHSNSNGLSAKCKFLLQTFVAIVLAVCLVIFASNNGKNEFSSFFHFWKTNDIVRNYLVGQNPLSVPFFKSLDWSLKGINAIFLAWLAIMGSSNSVNLTDGLDGLVVVPVALIALGLGIFLYITGDLEYSKYFSIHFVSGASELIILCASIAGSCLSFLWFNAYPAKVFMGDVGSLSLGAALGMLSVILRQEILFFIMSGLFVIEAFSVIIQVFWFKYTKYRSGLGSRIFRMAPLHHHLELNNWKENHVVIRFWIISLIFVLIGLASLEFR